MALYSGQILRVDQATHETSATYLTVTDNDTLMASQEAGTIYDLCGIDMATPPVLDSRLISGTLLDGSSYTYTVAHFAARGKDYYILPAENAPEAVATVASSNATAVAPLFAYLSHGLTLDDQDLVAGQALMISTFDGNPVQKGIATIAVDDDDRFIQFDGQNGMTNSETGASAGLLLGGDTGALDFDTGGLGQMVLVSVSYHAADGDHSFEALRYTYAPDATFAQVYYIPRSGSVDLATVLTFQGERVLTANPDGLRYADFGLGQTLTIHTGTPHANFIEGGFAPDRLVGLGGDDILVGGLGADRLEGGAANDNLHGGAQDDTMLGGTGDDALYGGNDRDGMFGGTGQDTLVGNWGDDSLYGGSGNDKLSSGSDNDLVSGGAGDDTLVGYSGDDRLLDGSGLDQLNGGSGADTFILSQDGSVDRITDFEHGIDLIDLGLAFADLTITTLAPGQVQIASGTDILMVFDTAHHLTAASFSAADFV